MWKSIYFKLNNTNILLKHRKVFNIPQEMSTFVDLKNISICVEASRDVAAKWNEIVANEQRTSDVCWMSGALAAKCGVISRSCKVVANERRTSGEVKVRRYFTANSRLIRREVAAQFFFTWVQRNFFLHGWPCTLQYRVNWSHLIIGS